MSRKLPLVLGLAVGFVVTAAATFTDTGLARKSTPETSVTRLDNSSRRPGPELRPAAGVNRRLSSGSPAPLRSGNASQMQHPTIYGGVIMTNDPEWVDWGIYEVPTTDGGQFVKVGRGDEGANRGGGVCAEGTYYSVRYFAFYGMEYIQAKYYDINTWQLEDNLKVLDMDLMAYDLSYDPISGKIYGCFYSKDSETDCWFGIADYREGVRTDIAKVDKWNAFAIDKNGNAYAVDMNGDLLSVDKQTGATTKIGSTGIVPRYPSSGTIDPRSGRLYWVVCPEDQHSYLYTVDLATAEATFVTQFSADEQVTGLYIPAPEAEETAPAPVSNLTLDFPQGNLSGNVTFTAPSTLFNGEAASGNLTYNVVVSGMDPITGTTSFGAGCSVPVTVPEAGNYEVVVTVGNEVGLSPRVKARAYIGKGVPQSTTAQAVYADGNATVSWTAVTESADGGYLDPEAVTYRVVLYPDETVIAEAATGTSLTCPLPEPAQLTSYYFTVTPCYDEYEGAAAQTNTIVLGSIVPPYSQSFDSEDALSSFTIIDGNNDDKTWKYSTDGSVRLSYNSTLQSDDWLITPPVVMEAGNLYRITFDVRNSYGEDYVERIEVMAGKGNSVADMTIRLLEPTEIVEDQWRTYEMTLTPETDGRYFIGIHGISDPDKFWVGIDNITISTGASTKAPAAVTELKATADINGLDKVEVSFVTPQTAIDGSDIDALAKVEVYRDESETPFKVFDAPATGAALSCMDEGVPTGTHTYSVTAFNSEGEGKTATASTFVGINVPSEVTDVTITETENPGTVTVTWQAPATDIDGNPINPDFITYDLCDMNGDVIVENVAETSYTARFAAPGTQEFALMGVIAVTETGSADPVYSPMIPVGKPYDTPYRDSFNSDFGGIMGTTRLSGMPSWVITVDDALAGVFSQDHDDALVAMKGSQIGDKGAVYTGKISLAGTDAPSLSIYAYKFMGADGANDDTNTLDIQIRPADGVSEYTTIKSVVNNELPRAGWNRLLVPLSEYKNQVVQIRFVVTIMSYSAYALDNLTVGDLPRQNLTLSVLRAPATVAPDSEFAVTATVGNTGTEDAGAFSVDLLCNGEKIDTRNIDGLAAGDVVDVEFTTSIPVVGALHTTYAAQIVYSADEQAYDDYAESTATGLKIPDYPAVAELNGSRTASGVELEWNAVDLSKFVLEPVTDSFEEYTAFSTAPCGDWKFVDGDGGHTFVPQDISGDGIVYDAPLSFFVMDADHPNLNGTFAANSGHQYLGAFYNTDLIDNDDWAIAPELSGDAQTITFYAKSYNNAYGIEKFEVLYSTTGNNIEDFNNIVLTKELETNDWTEISVDLPAGARYVAIHYISSYQYMFFVDDFSYMPAPWSKRLSLLGYNVYRDGVRLNSATVAQPAFTDTDADDQTHTYHVTAVYDKGESAPSAAFTIQSSGIDDAFSSVMRITAGEGCIIVTGAQGQRIDVCQPSGMTIYSQIAGSPVVTIGAEAGIYIVNAGGKTIKLVVR